MQCRLWSFLMCGASMLALGGCMGLGLNMGLNMGHHLETRTISAFIDSLEKSNIEELKEVSSTDFKDSALRHSKAVEAFKMLNLPEGKVEVVEVKDTGENEKRVLVKVGEKERKLYFDLELDPTTKKWVVKDVEFKKNLKPGQVNKSVTEQMDLLLSIQEILDAWEAGDRAQILATCTPDLRKSLEPLPPQSLKQLTAKITQDLKRDGLKPEVEGHANMALVRVKRKGGEMLLTLRREEDNWVADDIAVQSKKEDGSISSVRKQTQVLLTAIHFCDAYQAGNKAELQKTCQPRFFRTVLQDAELSRIPLPIKQADQEDYDIKLLVSRAEVLVKRKDQIIHLSLSQGPPKLDDDGKVVVNEAELSKPFLVEEVTLHEIQTKQEKRLSAMFSSQSLVMAFAEALASGDLKALRLESTTDFQNRVWARIELDDLVELPLDQIESAKPVIVDTAFKGPLTEVTVNQGSTPLTYVLRDQNGRLLVDDVLAPALDRPNSLKMNLEVQIPLRNFAKGLKTGDMRLVRDHASREFNKLVFQSMNRLPKLKSDPAPFLLEPVNRVQMTADRALLMLGDEHYGAKIFLNKENEHFVIDDILMMSGPEQKQHTGLKQSLRQLVLNGTRFGNAAAKNPIVPHTSSEDEDTTPLELNSESDPAEDTGREAKLSPNRDPRTSRILQTGHSRKAAGELRSSPGRYLGRNSARETDLENSPEKDPEPEVRSRYQPDPQSDLDAPVLNRSRKSSSARSGLYLRDVVNNHRSSEPSPASKDISIPHEPQLEEHGLSPGYKQGDDIDVIQPPPQ